MAAEGKIRLLAPQGNGWLTVLRLQFLLRSVHGGSSAQSHIASLKFGVCRVGAAVRAAVEQRQSSGRNAYYLQQYPDPWKPHVSLDIRSWC